MIWWVIICPMLTSDDVVRNAMKQKPSSQLQRGQGMMLMMGLMLTGSASVLDALL